ncbi:MAG: hypothetical protein ACREBD_11665 [Blastocatellia bacterium]
MLSRPPDFSRHPLSAGMQTIFNWLFLLSLLITVGGGKARCQVSNAPNVTPNVNLTELHGGIEITPRVIRAIALRIWTSNEGDNIKVLYYDQLIPSAAFPREAKFPPEYIREVAQSVQKMSEKLQRDFRLLPEQIYVVGLSDLTVQNRDELAREIRDRLGKEVAFLDTESEIQLGIAGTVPRRYKFNGKWYDNRSISMLLDISNSNIRGGYQQLIQTQRGGTEYDYVTWDIPRGTTSLAVEVANAIGPNADLQTYANRASLISGSYRVLARMESAKKPGLMTRRKVYLTGSIVWALACLLHPEDQRSYVPITIDDIDNFYRRAITDPDALLNPDLSKITDVNVRNEARRSREAVKAVHTAKSLVAGAELLKALASELKLADRTILYARYSYLARILSYVRLQPE